MEIRVKTLNPIALTCALALLLVLSAATTAAQSVTGSMFGSVLDSTGSAVQGAQVKLVYSSTGAERAALTDARGEFAINTLGQLSAVLMVWAMIRTRFLFRIVPR